MYYKFDSQCLSGINTVQILEPICNIASPKPHAMFDKRRSLYENLKAFLNSDSSDPQLGCRVTSHPLFTNHLSTISRHFKSRFQLS